jgi:hypothetical protein
MTSQGLTSPANGLHRALLSDSENSQISHGVAVCLPGAGWRFTSGVTYYTCLLASVFADDYDANRYTNAPYVASATLSRLAGHSLVRGAEL